MRILPGLAYNDMKRILPGFFSMAGKSTPAAGRLLFDGREEYPGPWPAILRWQGRMPGRCRGSFSPDFPMYKEVSTPAAARGFFLTSGAGTPYNDSLYRADLTRKGARGVCIKK